jgi:DNA modification methylase
VRLIRGDCLQIAPTLEGVDAVITDPPYGIQAAKAKAHSSIRDCASVPEADWDDERPPDSFLRMIPRIGSVQAVWGGNYFADCLPPSSGWLVWRKPEAETGFSLADVELCWTSLDFAARTKSFPRRDGNQHPTQKPVALISLCMDMARVPPGAMVLDPYMGSGTTLIAAIRTGRRAIGIEIDPTHYRTAVERVKRELAQPTFAFDPKPQPKQEALL